MIIFLCVYRLELGGQPMKDVAFNTVLQQDTFILSVSSFICFVSMHSILCRIYSQSLGYLHGLHAHFLLNSHQHGVDS